MKLSQLRKLHADCTTLASELAHSSNGGRREPLRGKFRAILAYAFRQCAGGRDINEQTIYEWRQP